MGSWHRPTGPWVVTGSTPRVTTLEAHAEAAYADLAARARDQGWERQFGSSTWWLLLEGIFVEVEVDSTSGTGRPTCWWGRFVAGLGRAATTSTRARGCGGTSATRWSSPACRTGQPPPTSVGPSETSGFRRALDAHREDVSTALAHLDVLATALQEAR